jgi:hypothetical protein
MWSWNMVGTNKHMLEYILFSNLRTFPYYNRVLEMATEFPNTGNTVNNRRSVIFDAHHVFNY